MFTYRLHVLRTVIISQVLGNNLDIHCTIVNTAHSYGTLRLCRPGVPPVWLLPVAQVSKYLEKDMQLVASSAADLFRDLFFHVVYTPS